MQSQGILRQLLNYSKAVVNGNNMKDATHEEIISQHLD